MVETFLVAYVSLEGHIKSGFMWHKFNPNISSNNFFDSNPTLTFT